MTPNASPEAPEPEPEPDSTPRATIVEDFSGPTLDPGTWIDHYLPQWTTPERSVARYDRHGDGLRLRIDADQPAWREADGSMRVSNLQTGTFSGPVGSTRGTHRHRLDGLRVVTPQPMRRLWTATSGDVSVRVSASADPAVMVGIWLVGLEESDPADSGELCIAELFGAAVGAGSSVVRMGVKAHHDPRLVDEIRDIPLAIDATEPHSYGVTWSPAVTEFSVDGRVVMTSEQRLNYELQLMIDLFEFPTGTERPIENYPKTALVHSVRATSR
jgi:hypothetical protein